jgi:DNA-binding PadR family transcriptional regulator
MKLTPKEEAFLYSLTEKPRYGLEIGDMFAQLTDHMTVYRPTSIYQTLTALEQKGLIRPSSSQDSRRKYYEISETGRKTLENRKIFLDHLKYFQASNA